MSYAPPPSDLLQVDQHVEDTAVIVRARGEVDVFTVPLLTRHLTCAADTASPPGPVIADLTRVNFFASKGIATLVRVHERCQELGVDFRVVAGRTVTHPLRTVGVLRTLTTCDTLTEALQPL